MQAWWLALSPAEQVLWGLAVFFTLLFVLQLITALLGFSDGSEATDMSTNMTTQMTQAVVNQGVKPQPATSDVAASNMPENGNVSEAKLAESQIVEGKEVSSAGNELPLNSVADDTANKEEVTEERLQEAVSQMNDFVQNLQRDLKFSIVDGSGETIVKVIDAKTDEVVRQIPSEEALELLSRFQESTGLLFKKEA